MTRKELTARQLRHLLDVRDKQLREQREWYLAELRLLRGQLFGVRARGKQTLSIPFKAEPSLAGEAPGTHLDSSSHADRVHRGSTAEAKSIKKELRMIVAQHTERRAVHVDVHMKELQAKIESAVQKMRFLQSRVEELESSGKAKLNRQVKSLRSRGLRMGAESERRVEALQTKLSKERSEKELARRQMVTAQMATKTAITHFERQIMKMCASHEKEICRAMGEMEVRLKRCYDDFAIVSAKVASEANVREIPFRSDRWAENRKMKEVSACSVKDISVQTAESGFAKTTSDVFSVTST